MEKIKYLYHPKNDGSIILLDSHIKPVESKIDSTVVPDAVNEESNGFLKRYGSTIHADLFPNDKDLWNVMVALKMDNGSHIGMYMDKALHQVDGLAAYYLATSEGSYMRLSQGVMRANHQGNYADIQICALYLSYATMHYDVKVLSNDGQLNSSIHRTGGL